MTKEYQGTNIRMSFVGYRDHCDAKNQYKVQSFTSDVDKMLQFIKSIRVSGGGDEPEDIAGGFKETLKLDWKAHARYAILVCDAPCHGR